MAQQTATHNEENAMSNSLVTIITPCYNGERFIHQYFQSILAQTYGNLELIFVNDGSTDRTEEIALSYREALEARGIVYKYLYQPNGGQAKAMNTGFQEMTGEFLVWPDSDDLLAPDSIEKRVKFLQKNPEFAMVRSNGDYRKHDTGQIISRMSEDESRFNTDIFMDLILEKTYCCCGCYMLRTAALREIYPDLRIYQSSAGQNWQILIPMAGRHPCGFIDEDLYHVIYWPDSHSRQKRTLQQEVDRRMELKKILLDGITRSQRRDWDYEEIVRIKYEKLLFRVYLQYGDLENGKKCYKAITEAEAVTKEERRLYIEHFCPIRYRLYLAGNLCKRAIGKGLRLLGIKK